MSISHSQLISRTQTVQPLEGVRTQQETVRSGAQLSHPSALRAIQFHGLAWHCCVAVFGAIYEVFDEGVANIL